MEWIMKKKKRGPKCSILPSLCCSCDRLTLHTHTVARFKRENNTIVFHCVSISKEFTRNMHITVVVL